MGTESNEQVTISIVGTGTGDGGGVAPTPSGTIATTEGTQPNLLINVITPSMAILVRFVTLFLKTFVGLLTAETMGAVQLGPDFPAIATAAALGSVSVAGVGLLKDLVTVFGRLEGKYPLSTGTI